MHRTYPLGKKWRFEDANRVIKGDCKMDKGKVKKAHDKMRSEYDNEDYRSAQKTEMHIGEQQLK